MENPKISRKTEICKNVQTFEKIENYEIFDISTKNVEHVLYATPTINSVNPACGVLIPTHGLCESKSGFSDAKQSSLCIGLPVPTAAAQTVSRVFGLACAAWLVCRHNAGLALHESP